MSTTGSVISGGPLVGLSGCSITGSHTVSGNTALQGTTTLGTNTFASNFTTFINGIAATVRGLTWQTAGSHRWRVGLDTAAESGGNAGGSFIISRFSDAGSLIDTPFTLSRASGLGQFNSGLTVVGTHTVGSSSTAFSTTSPMLTTATNLTGALTTGAINNNYGVWLMNLNSDAVDAGSGKAISGIYSYMQWGTSAAGGSRTGLNAIIKHTATSGNKAKSYASPFYVASAGSASSAFNDGGTSLAQYSAIFGGNFVSTLQTGATYWRECSAVEFNVAIETGASANRKNGIKVVKLADDATQALDLSQDTAFNVADQSGVAVGWQQGIGIGDRFAQWPMAATGALFRTFLSSNHPTKPSTVGYGVDALEADIAAYAFRSRGYSISGGSPTGAIIQNGPAQIAGTSTGLTIDTNVAVATAIAVSSGGSGYVNGEVFYFGNGGIGKVVAQTAGVVTSVSLYREPFDTSGTPPATLAVTSSWQPFGSGALSGTGLVLSVTWNTTATTLKLQPTAGGTIQTGSGTWSANGSVATALSGVGPAGAHTTVQEWFTVKNANGVVRYIPAF